MLIHKRTKLNIFALLTAVAAVMFISPAAAEEPQVSDIDMLEIGLFEEPILSEEPHLPGIVEGTRTYFEVADSNYIDITFESTEPVHLRLESVPQMVIMDIERAEDADSTQITLGGFEPNTTYYKYEDSYHNLTEFTTNESGSYSYVQDLTERHLVFIQPSRSTIFLSDSGWSVPAVGSWDSVTKTGTLTQNVSETIQIDSDGITLDGDGNVEPWSGTGSVVLSALPR